MMRRAKRFGIALAAALLAALLLAPSALAFENDAIPGKPAAPFFRSTLDLGTDNSDVYRIFAKAGQDIQVTLWGPVGTDMDLELYPPHALDFFTPSVATATSGSYPDQITYTAPTTGWYYIRVYPTTPGVNWYDLSTQLVTPAQLPANPERVWGSDRYSTAVKIAEKAFPGWDNVDHVIIASGEDRAAADPLAASGLSWAYGAPILLVQQDSVPSSVINALAAIRTTNGPFFAHVVGGPVSVPDERLTEIDGKVSGITFERLAPHDNRFELSATIARRMDAVRPGERLRYAGFPDYALIANGADQDKFFDALALSAVAARTGYPILLVESDGIPAPTAQALGDLGLGRRVIGGGPATVSDDVMAALGAGPNTVDRWSGSDRYETARVIADKSETQVPAWTQAHEVGVASKLPDALTGGALMGLHGGPILITPGDRLVSAPRDYLKSNTAQVMKCYTLGGPASIEDSTHNEIRAALIP